jgi:hypothetical protein
MKAPWIAVEDEGQKVAITLPQWQVKNALDVDPFEAAFGIAGQGSPGMGLDQENEAEPVFAVLSESGPTDGSAQAHAGALDRGFFTDLPAHAGDDVFSVVHLAAKAVVLAEMLIVWPRVAMDQEHPRSVCGKHIAKGCDNRCIGHEVRVAEAGSAIFADSTALPGNPVPPPCQWFER